MSKESLDQVIQRASSDARFRDSLDVNRDGALRGYDLSDEEKAQLAKGLGLKPSSTSPVPSAIASSADMSSADMSSADMSSADMSSADMSSADMSSVDNS
jgi:uncharacterized protein YjbI with pentapeptide repeats